MSQPVNKKSGASREAGFFDQKPVGCLLTDLHGLITEPTPSAAMVLGCKPNELQGRALSDFVLPSERLAFQGAIGKLVKSCDPATLVASIERPDGNIAVAIYTVHVATDQSDQPTELLWLIESLAVYSARSPAEVDDVC